MIACCLHLVVNALFFSMYETSSLERKKVIFSKLCANLVLFLSLKTVLGNHWSVSCHSTALCSRSCITQQTGLAANAVREQSTVWTFVLLYRLLDCLLLFPSIVFLVALDLTQLKVFIHSFVLDGKPSSCVTGIRHKLYCGTAGADQHRPWELVPTELAWRKERTGNQGF